MASFIMLYAWVCVKQYVHNCLNVWFFFLSLHNIELSGKFQPHAWKEDIGVKEIIFYSAEIERQVKTRDPFNFLP